MGQPGVVVHNFQERLAYSEKESDEPFWDRIYKHFFPDLLNQMPVNGDTESQRRGIDRVLFLNNGRHLNIQEKKREEDYPDILLEFLSNDRTDAPGWIEKDLDCDYLVYAFMESKTVYIYPWNLLRLAWLRYGEEWKAKYFNVSAENVGYTTWSVAVPIETLAAAIAVVSRVRLATQQPKEHTNG